MLGSRGIASVILALGWVSFSRSKYGREAEKSGGPQVSRDINMKPCFAGGSTVIRMTDPDLH